MNLDYTIYEQSNTLFARTVILNSSRTAAVINKQMDILKYVYNPADKTTWKYYMNMAGVYHASNTLMRVRSLDNDELIDFTADNMRIHVSTARSYQYGTDYYNELVTANPNQVPLIRGILNPIPYSVSTKANDFQIIWYDPSLIETGEDNVLPKLQQWLYTYYTQNLHKNYTDITDNLMHHFDFARIIMFLPSILMGIRAENIGTNYVHSFHIWSHLGSNAGLERYKPYLTRKQVLWLYRNIRYLTHNPGKRYEFDKIMEHLLTERSIPVAAYNAQHSTIGLLDNISPSVRFKRELLNMQAFISDDAFFRTTREIIEDQVPLARDNVAVYEEAIPTTTLDVAANRNSSIPTKVLESSMRDLSESVAFPHSSTLLNEWARLSSTGRYVSVISMVNPKTGLTMSMSVKEAFVLYLYAVWQGQGISLDVVPYYQATMCMRIPRPTFAQLKGKHGTRFVTDAWILQTLKDQPDIGNLISTEAFYNKTVEINNATGIHHDIWTYRNHHEERAGIELMVRDMYEDVLCDFWSGTTYKDFFSIRGWDLTEIQPEDWATIAVNLMATATGMDTTDQQKMADVQKAMLDLTLELSSYTIQVIRKINDQAIAVLDWTTLRVGDQHIGTGKTYYTQTNVRTQNVSMKRKSSNNLMTSGNDNTTHGGLRRRWVYDLSLAVGATASARRRTVFYADGATARIRDKDTEAEAVIRNDILNGLWVDPYVDARPVIDQDQVLNGLYADPAPVGDNMLNGLWKQPIQIPSQLLNGLYSDKFSLDEQMLNGLAQDGLTVNQELVSRLYASTLPNTVDVTNSTDTSKPVNDLDTPQWDNQ